MSGAEIHRRVSEAMAWRERRAGRSVRTARTGAFAAVAGELGWLPGQVAAAYYAAQQARAADAGRDALEHRPEEARARIAAQTETPGAKVARLSLTPEQRSARRAGAGLEATTRRAIERECPHGVDQLRDRAICNECEAALEEAAMARGLLS